MANRYSFGGGVNLKSSPFKNKEITKKGANILMILALLFLLIGGSYAMINFMKTSDANVIKTGQVSMSYTESNNVIHITNTLPITDDEGKNSSTYFDFTIMSNASTNANDNEGVKIPYNLILQQQTIETGKTNLTPNQIKVYLTKIENGVETQVLSPTLISKLSKLDGNHHLYTTENIHKNNNGTITTNYRLRAWIDYNVEAKGLTKNHQYKFSVNVNAGDKAQVVKKQSIMRACAKSFEMSDEGDNNDTYGIYGHRDTINKIVLQNKLEPIEGAIENWDLSETGDKSVMGYLVKNTNDDYHTAYIQGDGKIYAPENSDSLFAGFFNLNSIEGLEYLDTSNVTNMQLMFAGIGMMYIFDGDTTGINLDLSYFDTSKVTDMKFMFTASAVANLNLGSFNTSKVINIAGMFGMTPLLVNLDFRNATFSSVTHYRDSENENVFSDTNPNIHIITKNTTTKAWIQERLNESNITGATITTVE